MTKEKEKNKKTVSRVKSNQKLYKKSKANQKNTIDAINKELIIILIISLLINAFATVHFITYNHQIKTKIKTKIEEKEVVPENIVFLGDSITEYYDLETYYSDYNIVNSGISGNTTDDIINDMKKRVYQYNPSKVFLLIGTNDLNKGKTKDEIVENIEKIITEIKENRKNSIIYLESIYPVNKEMI